MGGSPWSDGPARCVHNLYFDSGTREHKKIKTRVKGQEEKNIYIRIYPFIPLFLFSPLPFMFYFCLLSDSCSTQYSTNILSINSRLETFIGSREIASDQNRALADKDFMFKGGIRLNNSYVISHLGFPGGASGKQPACQCRRHKETWVGSLGQEGPLEEGMATHSSILAWRIPVGRGAWWAYPVHRIVKSQTSLKQLTRGQGETAVIRQWRC